MHCVGAIASKSHQGWNILHPYLKENKTVKVKKNVPWNADMDNVLVEILFDQMAIGNKADPGWKPPAYRAAVNTLNARFNISINKENDKANGEGAENAADADEVMIDEETGDAEPTSLGLDDIVANEAINTPTTRARARAATSTSSQSTTKKRGRQVEIAGVVEMAESIKKYMSVKGERLCAKEVYEEVSKVVDLTSAECLDACQRFISGKVEEFRLLKDLPDEEKKNWIVLLLSHRTANCNGMGSACGDPRFIGGEGILFYFRRPEGRMRDNTWIQALGLMFESHTFTLSANKVSHWNDNVDQLLFTYDNMPVFINEGHTFTLASSDSHLVVERTAKCNSITVTFPGVSISGPHYKRR
ncbi:hypothetical protein HHK36_019580 [Tetracentron sinense]|uniref:Myb/SANT-like domain-containing protein n=1 Tax=Tetracentron sinense TaxID=13715 RepID=A0A834YWH3_TETSI|nr:hypothetical protein HHK36_019580 [Tetracentron sinense]